MTRLRPNTVIPVLRFKRIVLVISRYCSACVCSARYPAAHLGGRSEIWLEG